jgi:diguanylate cyclase (GGDEF)-like protein
VRHTDLVGRLGGEEFMILLPNTSPDAGRRLAEKLRANIEMTPTPWEKSHIRVTVSIGVACATFAQKREFDELYAEADTALYVAKDRGRNQVF